MLRMAKVAAEPELRWFSEDVIEAFLRASGLEAFLDVRFVLSGVGRVLRQRMCSVCEGGFSDVSLAT